MIGEKKSRGGARLVSVMSLILVSMALTGCDTIDRRDPTVIRLDAEVRLMKAAARPVSRQCLDALKVLTQTVKTVQDEHLSEDKKDPVAEDVLQNDQRTAERLCRPKVAALCQAPTGDESVAACKTLQRVPEPAIVY